ncbi:MAG: hypothetical protein HFI09_05085 [Bacilli bacterium]|nr:hypothetical protein [Bacilli bacterium]
MFNFIKKLTGAEDIKELIYTQNNNILAHERATEKLMREYEKDNVRLSQMLENSKRVLKAKEAHIDFQDNMLNEQNLEIQKLTKIIEDHKIYLKKVAEILQNNQKETMSKKISAVAYERNNLTKETKAKLK